MDRASVDRGAAVAGAKRKQRASSGASDVTDAQSEECPLLSPFKFSMNSSGASRRLSSASPSEAASLVIPRSPSDNSRLWAARIAATQRLARRKSGGGVAPRPAGSKKQALSFDSTPSFAESVTTIKKPASTSILVGKKSTRQRGKPGDDDVEMKDDEDETKREADGEKEDEQISDDDGDALGEMGVDEELPPAQPLRRSRRTSGRHEQIAKIKEEEPITTIKEAPARPQSLAPEDQPTTPKLEADRDEDVEIKREHPRGSRKRTMSSNANTSVPKTAKTEQVTTLPGRRARREDAEQEVVKAEGEADSEVESSIADAQTNDHCEDEVADDEPSVSPPRRSRRRSSELERSVQIKNEEITTGNEHLVRPRSLFNEENPVTVKAEATSNYDSTQVRSSDEAAVKQERIESELEELRRGMAALAASLEVERAEKAELKDQVESLSCMLLASQEKQARLETEMAELTASLRSGSDTN